jgi:hypothetical protein
MDLLQFYLYLPASSISRTAYQAVTVQPTDTDVNFRVPIFKFRKKTVILVYIQSNSLPIKFALSYFLFIFISLCKLSPFFSNGSTALSWALASYFSF